MGSSSLDLNGPHMIYETVKEAEKDRAKMLETINGVWSTSRARDIIVTGINQRGSDAYSD